LYAGKKQRYLNSKSYAGECNSKAYRLTHGQTVLAILMQYIATVMKKFYIVFAAQSALCFQINLNIPEILTWHLVIA
jgi:hypothetical protein